MRSVAVVVGAFLAIAFVTGCGPGLKAPEVDNGKVQVLALVDRGIADTADEDKVKQRSQMSDWMEADLAKLFTKNGYEFQVIESIEDYADAPHRFLLKVKVDRKSVV